jgi:hypothetical protein
MERPVGRNSCKISITLIVVELDGQSALAWEEIGIGECGGVSGFDLIGGAFGWAARQSSHSECRVCRNSSSEYPAMTPCDG